MKRSVKLFFELLNDDACVVLQTFEEYAKCFNAHAEWAFSTRCSNKNICHREFYGKARELCPILPCALVQTARDTALEAAKATKFKFKSTKAKLSAMRYDCRTLKLLKNGEIIFSTVGKRVRAKLRISSYHRDIMRSAVKRCGGCVIGFDKRQKKFYVVLVYELRDA